MTAAQKIDQGFDRIALFMRAAGTRYFTTLGAMGVAIFAIGYGVVLFTDLDSLLRQPALREVVHFLPPHAWAILRIVLGTAVLIPALFTLRGNLTRLRLSIVPLVFLGIQYAVYGYLLSLTLGPNQGVPTGVWYQVGASAAAFFMILGCIYADHTEPLIHRPGTRVDVT